MRTEKGHLKLLGEQSLDRFRIIYVTSDDSLH